MKVYDYFDQLLVFPGKYFFPTYTLTFKEKVLLSRLDCPPYKFFTSSNSESIIFNSDVCSGVFVTEISVIELPFLKFAVVK